MKDKNSLIVDKDVTNLNNSDIKKVLQSNLSNFPLGDEFGHRAAGDKIEAESAKIFENILPDNFVPPKTTRTIDDFTLIFENSENLYDVKSHFIQEKKNGFSMPNLISVKRLKGLLEDDTKSLSYIFVDYTRQNKNVLVGDIDVRYIWELDWSILGIGALGKGQLQIKDANKKLVFTDMGKDAWFDILKIQVNEFYKKELIKIKKEIELWK